jgi:predicted transcriptional regulator
MTKSRLTQAIADDIISLAEHGRTVAEISEVVVQSEATVAQVLRAHARRAGA